ncbi:MAG: LacI family DNA-binding transcriptional regulator [Anaerolineae bacterium]|nr:LacI family transcriptional regulator [Caldilineales bacterium]MCX7853311.1 LacI family transcriptional regulator [Caldilineales bacterium]MDW8269532.1 LacI family DNA-binding transcriptional regulator [Anaerolineae bacterium]
MSTPKHVTIKEIARRAGVSHSTVSRALNNLPVVAPETAARIRALAHELGYMPSATARTLKTNRSRVLGVIYNRIADPFYSEVLAGIQSVVHRYGYSVFVSAFEYDPRREEGLIRTMAARQVDALLLCSTTFTAQRLQEMGGLPIPAVFVHNRATDVLPHSIYHDDRSGTRALTQHLLELGHRRIAFGGNARGGLLHEQRRQGVVDALAEAGLRLDPAYDLMAPDGQMRSGAILAEQVLACSPRPTAILCFNDMQALGLMQVLQTAGLRIPDDISVAGFDDIPLAAFLYPALTTYHQPQWELGELAAQAALHMLGEPVTDPRATFDVITLQGRLMVRRSTAPPPVP